MRRAYTIIVLASVLVILAVLVEGAGLAKNEPYNPVIDPSQRRSTTLSIRSNPAQFIPTRV